MDTTETQFYVMQTLCWIRVGVFLAFWNEKFDIYNESPRETIKIECVIFLKSHRFKYTKQELRLKLSDCFVTASFNRCWQHIVSEMTFRNIVLSVDNHQTY